MWKDVPNWGDTYEVNEYGDVRNKQSMKLLGGDVNNSGYERVCLYNKPRKQRFFRHRLVATVFLDNPLMLDEVNHKDGNKKNNCVTNLEWCNRTHNEHEARRGRLKAYRPFCVLFQDGSERTFEFCSQLADEIGVTRRSIANYLQGKSNGYLNKGIKEIQYLK